jgi:hypothetical protein
MGTPSFGSHKEAEKYFGPNSSGERYTIHGELGHYYTNDVMNGGTFDPVTGDHNAGGKHGKFGKKHPGKSHSKPGHNPFGRKSGQDFNILGHAGLPGGHAGYGR